MEKRTKKNVDEDGNNFLSYVYISPTGTEVEIKKVVNTALYCVGFTNGGKNPPEFDGSFTSPTNCEEAIEKFFKRMQDKKDEAEKPKEKKTA